MNRIKEVHQEKGIKQNWLTKKNCKNFNIVNYYNNRRQLILKVNYKISELLAVDYQILIKNYKLY